MRIYDASGTERDWAWVQQKYGPVLIEGAGDFEVAELRENVGQMVLQATVLDEHGAEMNGVNVVFWFSSAPDLPGGGWREKGIVVTTAAGKGAHFTMSGDAKYDPATQKGPHAVWIYGEGVSPMVDGMGWLTGTFHEHLNITFRKKSGAPQPDKFPGVTIYDYDGSVTTEQRLFDQFWKGMWFWNASRPCYELKAIRMRQQGLTTPRKPEPVPVTITVTRNGQPKEGIPFQMALTSNPETFFIEKTGADGKATITLSKEWRDSVMDPAGRFAGGVNRRKIGIPKEDDGIVGCGRGWIMGGPDRWLDMDFEWAEEGPFEPPKDVKASQGEHDFVRVSWQKSSMWAEGYNVYRDGVKVYYTTALEWDDVGVEPGARHDYQLSSWDQDTETESALSVPVVGWARVPGEPPIKPQNLRATPSATQIMLQWDESPGATSYEVVGPHDDVVVYDTMYVAHGLESQTTYHFTVQAGNEHGWSPMSTIAAETLASSGCGCDQEMARIDAKLDKLLGKMEVAAEELPKVVTELERIQECCCE